MYYSQINRVDIANGIGVRVSLFVSGCRNRCKGCFNPETWNFKYGQKYTSETEAEIIEALNHDYITGLSILGGDPFEPENYRIYDLCKTVKSIYPQKDIWVYTGYKFETIRDLKVMEYIDVLVDGKFEEELKDITLRFKGSSNQRIIDVQESLNTGKVVLNLAN